MSIVAAQVGIDIAKRTAMVSVSGSAPFEVENSESAAEELADRLPTGAVVQLEASGGYERAFRRVLTRRGFEVRVLNPLNCRRLILARGVRAKTDRVDARALANLGAFLPAGEPKSIERQALCDLSRAIQDLQSSIARYKIQAKLPDVHQFVRDAYKSLAKSLRAELINLEKAFEAQIAGTPYEEAYKLAQSIPGVGKATARVFICELPENYKDRRPQEISSYAGLAPINDESGMRSSKARIRRGNDRIKAALFMPALSCIKRQEWARDLYAKLRAKGRCHQSAMVAVMRRLLLRILAVMQRETPWTIRSLTT